MLFNGKATDALKVRPYCDLCDDALAVVDCASFSGPWGYMCDSCFHRHGRGLGEGVGQVLLCSDDLDKKLTKMYLS